MSQNPQRSNLLSFFKPIPDEDKSQNSQQRATAARQASPLPLSSPPLSQASDPTQLPAAAPRPMEIAASDDEDEDGSSDDSLEDLASIFQRSRPAMTQLGQDRSRPNATPKAKRTAREFHSSPIAIMPKHQFDMKALAKDALQDRATEASALRAREANKAAVLDAGQRGDKTSGINWTEIVGETTGQGAQRVLRAVQRSGTDQSQHRFCFFKDGFHIPSSSPAPKNLVQGRWGIITKSDLQVRERHLVSGLPQALVQKNGGLPDQLFDWILEEVCVQRSILIRQEFIHIIEGCPQQVERRVTPSRLDHLWSILGASDELLTTGKPLSLRKLAEEPYQDADWSCVTSFIKLLGAVSGLLSVQASIHAIKCLLRLSMDRVLICDVELLMEYETTISQLLDAIPAASWRSLCFESCSLLHRLFTAQRIRINGLLCLPISNARAHEMRRKLALGFFFDDPNICQRADGIAPITSLTDHLSRGVYDVNPRCDFEELKAGIMLLNIAIDDESLLTPTGIADERAFNANVDALAGKLGEIGRKINDSGMRLSRTEAKGVLEWVQQRLAYAVRTRRKAVRSIFDVKEKPEDPFVLSRQQDLMKSFLHRKPKTEVAGNGVVHPRD